MNWMSAIVKALLGVMILAQFIALPSCRKDAKTEFFGPLPAPDEVFLSGRDTMLEIGLRYLEKHFEKKEYRVLKSYPDCAECVCSYTQQFEKGIVYTYNDCEIAGYEVNIQFGLPDVTLDDLRKLSERLFCCPSNSWNADSTRYEPADGDAGCYVELSENSPYTLSYFCSL